MTDALGRQRGNHAVRFVYMSPGGAPTMNSLLPTRPASEPKPADRRPSGRRPARGSDVVLPVIDPSELDLDVGDSTELIPRKRWERRRARMGLPVGAGVAFAVAAAVTVGVPAGQQVPDDLGSVA